MVVVAGAGGGGDGGGAVGGGSGGGGVVVVVVVVAIEHPHFYQGQALHSITTIHGQHEGTTVLSCRHGRTNEGELGESWVRVTWEELG